VKKRFRDRGMPVLACVADEKEAEEVRAALGQVPILAGSPLRLNDLYLRIHEMFDLASRRELRIRTELAVAYREPGIYTGDQYNYDTIRSLSLGGCFIESQAPFQVGMKIELVFCVGSGSRSLKVAGRVNPRRPRGSGGRQRHGRAVRHAARGGARRARVVPDEPARNARSPRLALGRSPRRRAHSFFACTHLFGVPSMNDPGAGRQSASRSISFASAKSRSVMPPEACVLSLTRSCPR